jgi:hypothetical protein
MNRAVPPVVLLLYAEDTEAAVQTVGTGPMIGVMAQVMLLAVLATSSGGSERRRLAHRYGPRGDRELGYGRQAETAAGIVEPMSTPLEDAHVRAA